MSWLFVLANPLFIIPIILGGGVIVGSRLKRSVRNEAGIKPRGRDGLKGLSEGKIGLQMCLNDFKSLTASDVGGGSVGTINGTTGGSISFMIWSANPYQRRPAGPRNPWTGSDRKGRR